MSSRRRRICLVTPGHLTTNPRLVKEADAFHEAGYDLRVVAARFLPWADEADAEFADRPWRFERIAFGPLASRADYVLQSARRRFLAAASRLVPLPLWAEERGFHPIVPELTRTASKEAADLYVAHNLAALPAAASAARRHGAKLGFDAEDFHEGELPDTPAATPKRRLVRRVLSAYLGRCAYVTAASPLMARAYADAYGVREPLTVLNVFPLKERVVAPSSPDVAHRPALYWFSQTIGPDRGLETVAGALGLAASRPHLYLRGRAMPDFVEELRRAAGSDAASRIHILPPIRPGELVREASRYDAGLCAENSSTLNHDICLSNKLFVYLLAGIPVLTSDTKAHLEIAPALGAAAFTFPQGSAKGLAAQVDALFSSAESMTVARARAWELGDERFNWDAEKRTLLGRIEALWV